MSKIAKIFRRPALIAGISFVAGIAIAETLPTLMSMLSSWISPVPRMEIARLTSPDEKVDAVTIEIPCGPVCSDTDLVYIVPKGQSPSRDQERAVFSVDDFTDVRLYWTASHLLEISYSKARINRFTNLSYPFAVFGKKDSWNYKVEIRLAPSSPSYSILSEKDIH